MTLRQYIQMEKLIHGREIPADILLQMTAEQPDEEFMYYSKSKSSLVSIFDMRLHHFIRAYALTNNQDNSLMQEQLSEIKKVLRVA